MAGWYRHRITAASAAALSNGGPLDDCADLTRPAASTVTVTSTAPPILAERSSRG
jgi:hypothetical protein